MSKPPFSARAAEVPVPAILRGHIPGLDGLRGVAVLLVITFHFVHFGGGDPLHLPGRIVHKLAMSGWIGVDLFFVLSGFLITGILLDNKGRERYFRSFYMRRVLRIFPLYYAALLLCLFVLPEVIQSAQPDARARVFSWTYLTNVLIARDGWRSVPLSTSHFWSLAVEEQFYLVWPLVVYLLTRRQLLGVCAGCITVGWAVRVVLNLSGEATAAYVLTASRMDTLAVGAAIAILARSASGMEWLVRPARRTVLALGGAIGLIFLWRNGLHQYGTVGQGVVFSLLAVFFGALLVTVATAPARTLTSRIFTSRLLRFFGRYSYGIYVFHLPVILLLRWSGVSVVRLSSASGYQLPAQLFLIALATALSIALALISWTLMEKPFLKLKDRYPYPTPTAGSTLVQPGSEALGTSG